MPVFVIVVGFGFFTVDIFFTFIGLSLVVDSAISTVGQLFVFGMAILGAITYANSLSWAFENGSIRWIFDHFLAPLLGMMFAIWVMLPFYSHCLMPFLLSIDHHQSFPDIGAGLCISIIWWVLALCGPPLAVGAMQSEDQVTRLASYAGFLVTASTWGIFLAVAARAPHG